MKRSRFMSKGTPRPIGVWCVECGTRCVGGEEIVLCVTCKDKLGPRPEAFEAWRSEAESYTPRDVEALARWEREARRSAPNITSFAFGGGVGAAGGSGGITSGGGGGSAYTLSEPQYVGRIPAQVDTDMTPSPGPWLGDMERYYPRIPDDPTF